MESKGCYTFGFNGCEVRLRYEYRFYDFTLEVTFYGIDLANLLDLTGQQTLKDMKFEAYIEVKRDNGRVEDQIIQLSVMIMNSTSTELRSNISLYERPYHITLN